MPPSPNNALVSKHIKAQFDTLYSTDARFGTSFRIATDKLDLAGLVGKEVTLPIKGLPSTLYAITVSAIRDGSSLRLVISDLKSIGKTENPA